MNQHQAPLGMVATLGHPSNKCLIVKAETFWRYVHSGEIVNDEDFRAGWDEYPKKSPEEPRQCPVMWCDRIWQECRAHNPEVYQ